MIWTEALVRHKIYITWSLCEKTLKKRHSRSCYKLFLFDWELGDNRIANGTYVGLKKQPKDWLSLTIAFAKGIDTCLVSDSHQPCFNVLLLCRQAFDEAAPIFYSQNCFVFCATKELQSMDWQSSGLLPAYAFLKDRSEYTLQMIKRIEIQFIDLNCDDNDFDGRVYPLTSDDIGSSHSHRRADLFSLLKARVNLHYLGLYIAGWSITAMLPDKAVLDFPNVTILESLCDLGQVDRFALKFVTRSQLLEFDDAAPASHLQGGSPIRCRVHSGHGSQCFVRAANEAQTFDEDYAWGDCGLAHESLRAAAFARLLRHYILKNGKEKKYQDINVVMGLRDDMSYLMLSMDDDKMGNSHLGDVQNQVQQTPPKSIDEIDTFAMVGGSCILDQVEPQAWTTPPWWIKEK